MARSHTLRGEIGRLDPKKAGYAAEVVGHGKTASRAGTVARQMFDLASRSGTASAGESALETREGVDPRLPVLVNSPST